MNRRGFLACLGLAPVAAVAPLAAAASPAGVGANFLNDLLQQMRRAIRGGDDASAVQSALASLEAKLRADSDLYDGEEVSLVYELSVPVELPDGPPQRLAPSPRRGE